MSGINDKSIDELVEAIYRTVAEDYIKGRKANEEYFGKGFTYEMLIKEISKTYPNFYIDDNYEPYFGRPIKGTIYIRGGREEWADRFAYFQAIKFILDDPYGLLDDPASLLYSLKYMYDKRIDMVKIQG